MSDVETICTTIVAIAGFVFIGWIWWLVSRTPEWRDPLGHEPEWKSTTTYYPPEAEEAATAAKEKETNP